MTKRIYSTAPRRSRRPKVARICQNCGAPFLIHQSQLDAYGTGLYCKKSCAYEGIKKRTLLRFWENVSIGEHDGCWEWIGYIGDVGYGVYGSVRAHRLAYELTFGKIPNGLFVCHKCDNKKCVNPSHLFLGTHQDNISDMMAKGRHNGGWPLLLGSSSSQAKLTEENVLEIRAKHAAGGISQAQLARDYGVKDMAISQIVRRKTWRHI